VIHYTVLGWDQTLARFRDPMAEVSAHYVISGDGQVAAMVPEDERAWHAGAGCWGGCRDVNSASIGVELVNRGDHPFAAAQMAALEVLLARLMDRWAIPPQGVIGHSDCAPARKQDPGPRFDWRGLARAGLAVWPEPGPLGPIQASDPPPAPDARDTRAFGAALTAIGYDPDLPDDLRLAAFRLRFRPGTTGPLGASDLAAAGDLARRFPVDPALGLP
jgi:N-acetylmuramoyl-L-alanine amidase